MVEGVKSTTLVTLSKDEYGSLKPICPFSPMPNIWISAEPISPNAVHKVHFLIQY